MLKKIRKMLKQQEGFTLVELMIVVVILGILAGVGIQQYGNVQNRAKTAAHNANVRIIASAANMYVMLENKAPVDGDKTAIEVIQEAGYLQEIPTNPFGEGEGSVAPAGAYVVAVTAPEGDGQYRIVVTPGAVEE
jgi:type IV pilus assembly protein PilA